METSLEVGALVVRPTVPPDDGTAAKRAIVAGAAVIAVLAGVGVTLLDYPWRMNSNRPAREVAKVRPAPPVVAAKPVESGTPKPAVVPPIAAAPQSAPVAMPAQVKPVVRERAITQQPKEASPTAEPAPRKAKRLIKRKLSIDARYARATKTCAPGFGGYFCRESVKWRLCKNRWSESPRAGEKRCYRPARSD